MNALTLKREPWNEGASRWLALAQGDYPLLEMAKDCDRGILTLFNVYQDGDHVASFVLRIDGHDEMVVVAAGGYLLGGSLYKILTPFVEELARENRCHTLRGHTSRAGVGRLMERAGWEQSEIVYRKEVSSGRKIIQQ